MARWICSGPAIKVTQMNADEGGGRGSDREFAMRRFRFSLGNMFWTVGMCAVGLAVWRVALEVREPRVWLYPLLFLGLPGAVGALVAGGRGMVVGVALGVVVLLYVCGLGVR